jgi:hypothetical protein
MATIDTIGTPFPKGSPLFSADRRIGAKVKQLESYIEIKWDLSDVNLLIAQIGFIGEKFESGQIPGVHGPNAQEGMIIAAIITYARMFNSAKGRSQLDSRNIFSGTDAAFHSFLMDLRNQFLAHQHWNANQHHLHYFKDPNGGTPRINPHGYTSRIPIFLNFDLEAFKGCISIVEVFLENKISSLSNEISRLLTEDQIAYLNSDKPDPSNPFNKLPAFSERIKT